MRKERECYKRKVLGIVPVVYSVVWIAWGYQRGNQNPYIEEQKSHWPKEKVQKDKQRCTKHTQQAKDRVTRTQLKTGVTSGTPEELTVPAPLVETSSHQTRRIWHRMKGP